MPIPFGDPARAPFVPTLLANPSLEEVTLTRTEPDHFRATTVAAYRQWGLVPPSGSTLPVGDPEIVCCWLTETALIARCGSRHWQIQLPEHMAGGIRQRGEVAIAVSTAIDPSQLENPEPLKRVLRAGDLAVVRARLSTDPAPVLRGHTVVVESDYAQADETRDEDWLAEITPYRGPTYDATTGRFSLGMGMDGPVHWVLNTPGKGVENGLVAGPRDLGKTNNLRLVTVEAVASGVFVCAVADPHNRNGLVEPFEGVAERIARSPEETVSLLAWGVVAVERRMPQKASYRDPSPERPGVLLVVDDAHEVLTDPGTAALAERIAVAGPQVGIGLVVASRSVDASDFGGRHDLLAALAATNCMVFDKEMADQVYRLRKPR